MQLTILETGLKYYKRRDMAFRHIVFESPAYLSAKNNQLVIAQTDQEAVSIPLEDIATITLENNEIVLTNHLLREALLRDIAIVTCDVKHTPLGLMLPFQNHIREFFRIREQFQMKKPLRKRLWQKIIRAKIQNSAICLKENKKFAEGRLLEVQIEKVGSGDPQNIESYSARLYFQALFGNNFSREGVHPYNAFLDYGYAIIRSNIARMLTAYGFIPSLGIHHRNQYNNFNLADDLIEPWRAVVDLYVSHSVQLGDNLILTPLEKHEMAKITQIEVRIADKKVNVTNGISISIQSLVTSMIEKAEDKLLLPTLVPLRWHTYE